MHEIIIDYLFKVLTKLYTFNISPVQSQQTVGNH